MKGLWNPARRRLIRCVLCAAASAWVAPLAGAAVSISIVSPQTGEPTNPVPRIRVAYSSSAAPLNLGSFRVLVGGEDWTSRFAVGPSSATYEVGATDSLVAGSITISAEIRDGASPPSSAAVTQTYDVFPQLVDFTPGDGRMGDQMAVEVLGLDPNPANSLVEFAPCVQQPLLSADRATRRGALTVPEALSGRLRIIVNGKASARHARPFRFPPLVAAGLEHAFFTTGAGVPYAMGANSGGQLGIGSSGPGSREPVPTPVAFPSPVPPSPPRFVSALAGGRSHSLAVTDDGEAWGWGRNDGGQLGDGSTTDTAVPKRILDGYRIRAVAALIDSSFALTCGGDLLSFGWNSTGELGIGTVDLVPHPNPTPILGSIGAVSAGSGGVWTMALSRSGALYGWGWNVTGQAGNGSYGEYLSSPIPIPLAAPRRISSGGAHSLAITHGGGAVFGWGVDNGGQVGNGQADNPVESWYHRILSPVSASGFVADEVSAGYTHSLALTPDRLVMQWGYIPISDTRFRKVYAPELVPALNDMVSVAAGGDFSLAWKADGTLWTWGYNGDGALGDGTFVGRQTPEPVFRDCSAEGLAHRGAAFTSELPGCPVPVPPVVILGAETTRWKPQRDASTPIVVSFDGPADLTPATTLEIVGPDGSPVAGPALVFEEVPPDTSPQQYRITWNGPWTRPDGTPLPAGNYTVKVKGRREDGSSADSDPYSKVSLVEVTLVELGECATVPGVICPDGSARLDVNTASGGGKAVHPDARAAGGNYERTILVKAKLEPHLAADSSMVSVHFRSIDVDDPSASTGPIDNDATATTSQDNRLSTALITPTAQGVSLSGETWAIGFFKPSTQQGDNYRLAASTHAPWLMTLCGEVSSGAGAIQKTPCSPGGPPVPLPASDMSQVSELLTVWRTLHLELDRIDPATAGVTQPALDQQRDWTNLQPSRLVNQATGIFDADHDLNRDWLGAQLSVDFHPQHSYRVTNNQADRVDVALPSGSPNLLNGQQAGTITARGYVLRDDELTQYGAVGHDMTMLKGLLEQVYVRVEPHSGDTVNPNAALTWTRVMTSGPALGLARDAASSKPFWAVPFILAFEGHGGDPALTARENERRGTHDPSNHSTPGPGGTTIYHGGLLGVTYPGPGGNLLQPKSLSFIETIRDFKETNTTPARATVTLAEIYASNAAHEVLHALALAHRGGIMCAKRKNDASDPMRFSLTPTQLSELRSLEQPKWPTQPDALCGLGGAVAPECCPR
jgi:alpha-tubulin suppressor-like RCC1 family protein